MEKKKEATMEQLNGKQTLNSVPRQGIIAHAIPVDSVVLFGQREVETLRAYLQPPRFQVLDLTRTIDRLLDQEEQLGRMSLLQSTREIYSYT
ncbi:hypothetical protein PROFUN_09714 [Planoprotostelium fungivorum]|uniref:Uncharacterized protein n=1 Tax=Planoprotostelium fungivorum TaxID=1890364 RepID=A0A2P6NET6_9EUKA|nr:hypothetical protein PROFUN_09714 [Planoprotostelium fungivorum]